MDIRKSKNFVLTETNILCGNLDPVSLLRTGHGVRDDLLVIGWTRELFATSDFEHLELPSLHILQSIVPWYSVEMIHVIEDKGGHYAIPLQDVMTSVDELKANRKRKLKLGGVKSSAR